MSLRGLQLPKSAPTPSERCEAHRTHRPRNLTVEEHHIIPQAWQHLWIPQTPQAIIAAAGLWHPETMTLCPTGHRNVHFWLVKYMKEGLNESIPSINRPTTEQTTAQDAMILFTHAGGSLAFLREQHAYGYA